MVLFQPAYHVELSQLISAASTKGTKSHNSPAPPNSELLILLESGGYDAFASHGPLESSVFDVPLIPLLLATPILRTSQSFPLLGRVANKRMTVCVNAP